MINIIKQSIFVLLLIDDCWALFWAFTKTKRKLIVYANQCINILNKINFYHWSSICKPFYEQRWMNEWISLRSLVCCLYHHFMSHNHVIEQPIDQNQWKDGSSDRISENNIVMLSRKHSNKLKTNVHWYQITYCDFLLKI
jgi:hypothetical protein